MQPACSARNLGPPARRSYHLPIQPSQRAARGELQRTRSSAAIGLLGLDVLTFLGSTVVVVPLFKKLNISPVLGFLFSGVVLHQFGLIRDPKDMEALSELGVLFLLFEMGLELSLDRLKALAKYAFGLGSLQMLTCTAIFTAFSLPVGQGLGTRMLEGLAHASPSLVSIRSVDEAIVIGGALSMSSSAFVLQLLSERGEMPTRTGAATLGILLFQDIAVVPFLVLLPVVVQLQHPGADANGLAAVAASGDAGTLLALLGPTALKTLAGLGLLLVGGRLLLRRVFEVVAQSDNSETFVGLCLLTVAGAALCTQSLGFSDTLGAFTAGVLLSESSFKTQVEADIRPFRGLLLGLFFVTTGSSMDMNVLRANWQVIGWILAGLLVIKTSVVAALGPRFGLTRSESIRTGFILSQGGEFAFVLLSLAYSLNVLPENLNQVLIIVVVLSMALTPALAELGKVAGDWVEDTFSPPPAPPGALSQPLRPTATSSMDSESMAEHNMESPVVICGFGPHGQMLAALLDMPLASLSDERARSYIAFDLDPVRVQAARAAGFNVIYGDGSRPAVLKAAGVEQPSALAVCLTSNKVAAHRAVASLRLAYPNVPLYALGSDIRDAAELEEAGADKCVVGATAAGLSMGGAILARMGASVSELSAAQRTIEKAMTERTASLAEKLARYGSGALEDQEQVLVLGRNKKRLPLSASGASASTAVSIANTASTPAPPDTLPSMAEAMPSNLARGLRRAPVAAPADPSSTDGLAPAGSTLSVTMDTPIAATAIASLECGPDDMGCVPEDVAGMVQVDAEKQQAVSGTVAFDVSLPEVGPDLLPGPLANSSVPDPIYAEGVSLAAPPDFHLNGSAASSNGSEGRSVSAWHAAASSSSHRNGNGNGNGGAHSLGRGDATHTAGDAGPGGLHVASEQLPGQLPVEASASSQTR